VKGGRGGFPDIRVISSNADSIQMGKGISLEEQNSVLLNGGESKAKKHPAKMRLRENRIKPRQTCKGVEEMIRKVRGGGAWF